MKTTLLLINNPISGGNDKTDILEQISKELDSFAIAYKIYNTSGNQDLDKIQDLLAQKTYAKIMVLGGDGTVLMAARANMKHNIPIGIIPLGSANGLATDLKIDPKPLIAFKNHLCSEYVEHIDLLKINKEFYGIHIGDVGINANLVEKFSQDTGRGMKTYAKYFMEELNSLDHFKVDIITPDQKLIQEPVIMTAICNSNRYGTGVVLNNIGKISDGKFEIVMLREVTLSSLIKAGLSIFDSDILNNQKKDVLSVEHAVLKFDRERTFQMDGEVLGKFSELEVEIIPRAIPLITIKPSSSEL